MPKFTFKNGERPKGLAKIGWTNSPSIKLNGKKVGYISGSSYSNHYTLRFSVMKTPTLDDGNSNCAWMWITLPWTCLSIESAKEYLNEHIDEILKSYTLKQLE